MLAAYTFLFYYIDLLQGMSILPVEKEVFFMWCKDINQKQDKKKKKWKTEKMKRTEKDMTSNPLLCRAESSRVISLEFLGC